MEKGKEAFFQLLFPRVCPVCGEILTEKERADENPYICRFCYKTLQFAEDPKCLRCGVPLTQDDRELCENCEKKPPFFDQGIALLVHDDPARKMLYDLKYARKTDNADFFGREVCARLGNKILQWDPELVLPVPLHKRRQFERGFNQAELLAEKLSEHLKTFCGSSLSVDNSLLQRTKKTRPQKELSTEERAENVSGKFCLKQDCGQKAHNPGLPSRVLLLDDIYTSGATINECAKVLKQGGVKEVYFLTMSIVG